MSRTNDLRSLIETKLLTIASNVYYEIAIEETAFPYVVFTLDKINLGDLNRGDYTLDIDVWDKSSSAYAIEQICDQIEDMFNNLNSPQSNVLPTFYIDSRNVVRDADKTLKHRNIKVIIQNYERS